MADQGRFSLVSEGTNGTSARSAGTNESGNEMALAYSARAYHRKAHKPRPAQSEDETASEGWTSRIARLLPRSIRSRINPSEGFAECCKGRMLFAVGLAILSRLASTAVHKDINMLILYVVSGPENQAIFSPFSPLQQTCQESSRAFTPNLFSTESLIVI